MPRSYPRPDATVEIDVPGAGTVSRRVLTVRDHGDGRYTCTLAGPDGIEAVTITPAGSGWVCVQPPVSIHAAVITADKIKRGETLHGSANAPLHLLADAVLLLTGRAPRPQAAPCAARMAHPQTHQPTTR